MNSFIFLILLIEVFVECGSSCEIKDENITAVQHMFWTKNKYYKCYEVEQQPLERFLKYIRQKTRFVHIVDVEFPKLQCEIETICTTTKPNTEEVFEERNLYSFCELFYIFEHKKEFIIIIKYLELALISHQNFTIHSNQLFRKSGLNIFNRR